MFLGDPYKIPSTQVDRSKNKTSSGCAFLPEYSTKLFVSLSLPYAFYRNAIWVTLLQIPSAHVDRSEKDA